MISTLNVGVGPTHDVSRSRQVTKLNARLASQQKRSGVRAKHPSSAVKPLADVRLPKQGADAAAIVPGSAHFVFNERDFAQVRRMIYERAGIALGAHKHEMVYSRLARRLRALRLSSFSDYLEQLRQTPENPEWEHFINALTTNLTAFFREPHHFPILQKFARDRGRPLSVWCSAASTGEEPYSIAIALAELSQPGATRGQVLATDINTEVLRSARAGVYPLERIAEVSTERRKRFFMKGRGAMQGKVRVSSELADMVTFQQLNLLDERWNLPSRFDAIFCRNVMIYFDKPTQGRILARFARLLEKGGLLFAGHSENFTYVAREFRLLGRTVYERV